MRKIKYKRREIQQLAEKIVSNSEMFGDEVENVACELGELSSSANKYGCEMEGRIHDYRGEIVGVVAIPDRYRHNWSF